MTSTYGRQWFHPNVGESFSPPLLTADRLAMHGKADAAIKVYKSISSTSAGARRRLVQARRQAQSHLKYIKPINEIGICAIDWYPGFSITDSFISKIFDLTNIPYYLATLADADLIIAGCYGTEIQTKHTQLTDRFILFVSGENLLPSYDLHDFSLTTFPDSFCGKNIRYPQWYGELSFETVQPRLKYSERCYYSHERDIDFSFIYNNSTPQREEMLCVLKQAFGDSSIKVYGVHRGSEVDKLSILARSKINICFENSIGKGYCTEKLLHALSMGCYALYWGDPSYLSDFKGENIFNLYEHSHDEAVDWCRNKLSCNIVQSLQHPLPLANIIQSSVDLAQVIEHIRLWMSMIVNFRSLL